MYFSDTPSGGTIMQSEVWRKGQTERFLRSWDLNWGQEKHSPKCFISAVLESCAYITHEEHWEPEKKSAKNCVTKINTENWTPSSSNVSMINTTSVRQRGCQSGFCWDTVNLLSPVLLSWSAPPLLLDNRDHLILITVCHQPQQSNQPKNNLSPCSKTSRDSSVSFRMRANVLTMTRKPYTILLLEHIFPSPLHCPLKQY